MEWTPCMICAIDGNVLDAQSMITVCVFAHDARARAHTVAIVLATRTADDTSRAHCTGRVAVTTAGCVTKIADGKSKFDRPTTHESARAITMEPGEIYG
jgi:hypothetical protein